MNADTRKEGIGDNLWLILLVVSIWFLCVGIWNLDRRLTRLETAPRAEVTP